MTDYLNIISEFGKPRYKLPKIKNRRFIEKYQYLRMKLDSLISYGFFGIKRKYYFHEKKINEEKIIRDGFVLLPGHFKEFAKKFKEHIDLIIRTVKVSDSGAKMEFFSGKHFSSKLKSQSSSKYYAISQNNLELKDTYNFIKEMVLYEDIIQILSIISGYMVEEDDISIGLGIVNGENSNSEWHTDVFCNTGKMFIYLDDVDEENSPFEFMIGTVSDMHFRSKLDSLMLTPSARLVGQNLKRAENNFKVVSCLGNQGTMIAANTCGIHRKGKGNPLYKRYALGIATVRLSMLQKLIRNFKYRFRH